MPGLAGLELMPRNRALLSFLAVNSEKNVFGAKIAASLTIRAPESASVCLETAVTLTGTFCASAGSFVAVTVTVGSVVRRMPSSSGFAGCAAAVRSLLRAAAARRRARSARRKKDNENGPLMALNICAIMHTSKLAA